MRSKFDEQLDVLNKDLIAMGALCESAITKSAEALLRGDSSLAETVMEISRQIDHKERDIEALCMKLLLQQQPVATDLRVISSALKMVTDMERVGYQSADIAEIITMGNIKATDTTQKVHDMAVSVIKMVTDSIDAFVKKDMAIAKAVIAADDVVDSYFNKAKEMLIDSFGKPEADGEHMVDLLMVAKYLERIGDHAVNIAKWVIFSITGSREGGK